MIFNIFLFIDILCLLFSFVILYKAIGIARKRIYFTHNIINKQISTMETVSEKESNNIYTILNSNKLVYLVNAKTNEVMTHLQTFPCIVGRDADISMLNDPTISRRHIVFTSEGNDIYIEDLKSTNGTWINEKKLLEKQKIRNKDKIRIVDCVFLVRIETINSDHKEK